MKDFNGNELAEGDVVHIKCGSEWLVATIAKIHGGGIAVTGIPTPNHKGPQGVGVTPDVLVLQLGFAFQSPPGMPHPEVVKLDVSAKQKEAVGKILTM